MKQKVTERKKKGVASLVCSIVSLLICLAPYFGLPLAILGVVFAYGKDDALASAGKTVGIISIVVNSMMLLFMLVVFSLLGI